MRTPSAFRSDLRLLLLLLLLLLLAGAEIALAQSLWTGRGPSLVADVRASRAGDLVTILIDEQSAGSKSGETKLSRDSAAAFSITPPAWDYPSDLADILNNLKASGTGKSDYSGGGSTTRTDKATGLITAKVARVFDNGNLLIEGRRLVVVHDENLVLVVTGIARPQDIGPDNVVRSSALADAEVRIEGKGTIAARQRPGLLQKVFEWLGIY
jgi:flagellar L-ring protein precursor FlgH